MLTGDVETPSSRVLREIFEQNISYSDLMGRYADSGIANSTPTRYRARSNHLAEAIASLRRQRDIEFTDSVSFDAFLHEFYAQYRLKI